MGSVFLSRNCHGNLVGKFSGEGMFSFEIVGKISGEWSFGENNGEI